MKRVSLIIPTYNEADNLKPLIEEIESVVDANKFDVEFIIVDDNSPDDTGAVAEQLKSIHQVRVIHRSGKMGLGSAVIVGFQESSREYLGVMDADLSHDPRILNSMLESLEINDIAIGSRFEAGSSVEQWKWWRKLTSYIGVFFARIISGAKDPLSGYFVMRRSVIDGVNLETQGYKILFEILVKGNWKSIREFPYTFRIRERSASKLNGKEYLLFGKQIIEYAIYKYKSLFRYVIVGGSAFVLDMVSLYMFKEWLHIHPALAVALNQIFVLSYIFVLNKQWAFNSSQKINKALIRFVILQGFNYCFGILWMFVFYDVLGVNYLVARVANIVLFTVWNFFIYKTWVFKKAN